MFYEDDVMFFKMQIFKLPKVLWVRPTIMPRSSTSVHYTHNCYTNTIKARMHASRRHSRTYTHTHFGE